MIELRGRGMNQACYESGIVSPGYHSSLILDTVIYDLTPDGPLNLDYTETQNGMPGSLL